MKIITNKTLKAKLQASFTDGQRSILLAPDLYSLEESERGYYNNYIEYDQQVKALYEMYYGRAKYGAQLTRTAVDLRTALICGEGLSIRAENEKTQEWIDRFLDINNLHGYNLASLVKHGDLEGKQLIVLKKGKKRDREFVEVRQVLYYDYKYKITVDPKDREKIVKIYYLDGENNEKIIPTDKAVFIKLSGRPADYILTTPKLANAIQNIKNYDRALFDLRRSNHHFGFPTPAFEAKDEDSAKETRNAIAGAAGQWKIGSSFIGTAKMYYPMPPNSQETLSKEMSINLKAVSAQSGVPVHWLGWTDLMSNRATATDLAELVNASTKIERFIWADKMYEVILKAMIMSKDEGLSDSWYDPEFTVTMPYISLEFIEQINNTWLPLNAAGVISMQELRGMIPGLNPAETERLVNAENEKVDNVFDRDIMRDLGNNKMENEDGIKDVEVDK